MVVYKTLRDIYKNNSIKWILSKELAKVSGYFHPNFHYNGGVQDFNNELFILMMFTSSWINISKCTYIFCDRISML